METKCSIALVMAMSTLIATSSSLDFNFPNQVSEHNHCGSHQAWHIQGEVSMADDDFNTFGHQVVFETVAGSCNSNSFTSTEVCALDLGRLDASGSCAQTTLTHVTHDCRVIGREGNIYTLSVSGASAAAASVLQVVSRARNGTSFKHVIGHVPELDTTSNGINMTYQVDGNSPNNLQHSQTIYVSKGQPIELTFCKVNPEISSTATLRFENDGQTTESKGQCLAVITKYDFVASESYEAMCIFEERKCFVRKLFLVQIEQKNLTYESSSPVSTTTQLPLTARQVCIPKAGSLPRQVSTLPDGTDVLCDTVTDGGNWIVFQRRASADGDFFRNWTEYQTGFGDLQTNFWLGLDNVHTLCLAPSSCELRIDMRYANDDKYATYQDFWLSGASDGYRLHVGAYSGTAGDVLTSRGDGEAFSTKDQDNDRWGDSCANKYEGAWWYDACHRGNLNGRWGNTNYAKGLNWTPITGYHNSVTFSEMKIRLM